MHLEARYLRINSSLRTKGSNPDNSDDNISSYNKKNNSYLDCFVSMLLAMTEEYLIVIASKAKQSKGTLIEILVIAGL
ncbi:MAG: hypothetical protein V3575_04165 [Candidatus Absconditabacteria bacterium]